MKYVLRELGKLLLELGKWAIVGAVMLVTMKIPTMTTTWWHSIPILVGFTILIFAGIWLISRLGRDDK